MPAVARHLLVASALLTVAAPSAAAAQTPGTVELSTEIGPPALPVPGGPTYLGLMVTNVGEVAATNIQVSLQLPAGAAVTDEPGPLDPACSATPSGGGTTVTCELAVLSSGTSTGWGIPVTFDAVGSYGVSADAHAEQPDADGDATSTADVVVVEEDADLYGQDVEGGQVLAGEEVSVLHIFRNGGPTSFVGATVSGTFPAGLTPLPGQFWLGSSEARADELCSIDAAGFTCGPIVGDTNSWIDAAQVTYRAVAGEVRGPIEATATIAGRADPDHTDDTSTFSVDVVGPAADLYVPPGISSLTWYGQATHDVVANIINFGELVAAPTEVTVEVPEGWTVGLPSDPDPPDRSCAVAPDSASLTCTFDELPPLGAFRSFHAPVTSPAGPSAPGLATIRASTPVPQHDQFPDEQRELLVHVGDIDPLVDMTPSSGLVDGQTVDIDISGFPPGELLATVVCAAEPDPTPDDCDVASAHVTTTSSAGTAAVTRAVPRFNLTGHGILDCAVDDCVLFAVVIRDRVVTAQTPIEFAPGPPPTSGIGLSLGPPGYLLDDPSGPATIPAWLSCDEPGPVTVTFGLYQPVAPQLSPIAYRSTLTVDCAPGSPMPISSDLTGLLEPGMTGVLMEATAGDDRTVLVGEIEVLSAATARALLQARLADPNDTTVVAELVASFLFRVQHHPVFLQAFKEALRG